MEATAPPLALSPLSNLTAIGVWEQKPAHRLLIFTAASLQWPWRGRSLVSMTWLVRLASCCSKQRGSWLSCGPPSHVLCPAKAMLTLGKLQCRRLLLVTNQASRTEVRTNSTWEGGWGKRERKKNKDRERKKAALIIG